MLKTEVKPCVCGEPTGCHPETDQQGFWMACNDCGGMVGDTYEYFDSYEKVTQCNNVVE
ncbi:hypothetical protein [Eubacterium sp. 1001713B170207_170306_E7]|uniref:hypothetical protein n=1 Tax=Eubacterium sp. 1001713B170207_170306_E7 TaxID=2787097 RepID=UPI00189A0742|nr:hypothetical protein [Eubacterium sp. 1001713B170207_170306_E7]